MVVGAEHHAVSTLRPDFEVLGSLAVLRSASALPGFRPKALSGGQGSLTSARSGILPSDCNWTPR